MIESLNNLQSFTVCEINGVPYIKLPNYGCDGANRLFNLHVEAITYLNPSTLVNVLSVPVSDISKQIIPIDQYFQSLFATLQ